jgi:hypothetical protein
MHRTQGASHEDAAARFACPVLILCDEPVFTRICVTGSPSVINGSCQLGGCPVAVEERTWTQVKRIYEN